MLAACQEALPVDVAVCAAAVSDWRVAGSKEQKIKKPAAHRQNWNWRLIPTSSPACRRPATCARALSSASPPRPKTSSEHATAKLSAKGCDWILANDVSAGSGTFGGGENTIHLIEAAGVASGRA